MRVTIAALRTAVGYGLILAGLILLATVVGKAGDGVLDRVALAAILMLTGIPFLCPSILREDEKNVSAMRVIVYVVVSLFVAVTLRASWHAKTLGELTLDRWWCALIAAAIGGKAAQSFSEPPSPPTTTERPPTPPPLLPRQ